MSAYYQLIGTIRGVSEALLPGTKFIHGTYDVISRASVEEEAPLYMAMYEGFILRKPLIDDSTEATSITIEIMLKDAFDSDSIEQENLMATANILADQFLNSLNDLSVQNGVSFQNVQKVPFFKRYSGTYTGLGIGLDVQIGECSGFGASLNLYPDLSEFMNEIGKDISPLDWQGITQRS